MTEAEQRRIFSYNLNRILDAKGLRQIDIVEEFGVGKATVSGWCNGQKMPRMGKIDALAKWLGVSLSDLLENSNAPKLTPEQQKVIDLTNKIIERLNTATPEQLETVSAMLDAFLK